MKFVRSNPKVAALCMRYNQSYIIKYGRMDNSVYLSGDRSKEEEREKCEIAEDQRKKRS